MRYSVRCTEPEHAMSDSRIFGQWYDDEVTAQRDVHELNESARERGTTCKYRVAKEHERPVLTHDDELTLASFALREMVRVYPSTWDKAPSEEELFG